MDPIRVAAGLVAHNGELLIARRGPQEHLSGYWEFPGGKVELGEDPEATIVRELWEELRLPISVEAHFMTVRTKAGARELELVTYWASTPRRDPILHVHDSIAWVTIDSLALYRFAPADMPVVRSLSVIDTIDYGYS